MKDPFIYLYTKKMIMPIDRREIDDLDRFLEMMKKHIGDNFVWGRPTMTDENSKEWFNIKYWENDQNG